MNSGPLFNCADYRPDIDGLRAIAVLSVALYHFRLAPFSGGFTGVDVFFVISGFLITRIIVRRLHTNSFSFASFYQDRIRRIFPALMFVLLFVFAWAVITNDPFKIPSEFSRIARSIAAGAAFVANFVFWTEPNYFTRTVAAQPLLHLWSLAIEEQFYLVWPMVLFLTYKFRIGFPWVICTAALLSFGANIATVHSDPVGAFYSPLTRAWELMIGAAVVFWSPMISKQWLSVIGLGMVLTGFAVITTDHAFPGWLALLPTLGTAFLISAGPTPLCNRLLRWRPFVWIGLISYPLYLWHWPALLIFDHYEGPLRLIFGGTRPAKIVLLCVCVLVSALTYQYVEKPVRFGLHRRAAAATSGVLMIAIAVGAFFSPNVIQDWGLSRQQKKDMQALTTLAEFKDLESLYGPKPCFKYRQDETYRIFVERDCLVRRWPDRPTVLLIGDSHSASLSLGLRAFYEARGINFLQVSTGFCEPTSNNAEDRTCSDINTMVEEFVRGDPPDLTIFDSYWVAAARPPFFVGTGAFFDQLLRKLERLQKLGATRIVVVGEIPTWNPSLPLVLADRYVRLGLPIPERAKPDAESLSIDDAMKAINFPTGTRYVSLKDLLCEKDQCMLRVGPGAQDLILWDYGHLTPRGAAHVVNLVAQRYPDLLMPN